MTDDARRSPSRARFQGAMAVVSAALSLWLLLRSDDGPSAFRYYVGERPMGEEGASYVVSQLTGMSPLPDEGGSTADEMRRRLRMAIAFGLTSIFLAYRARRAAPPTGDAG